jgi:nitroreductase
MRVDDAIRQRRSVRSYEERDVPDELVEELLGLTRYAPSSMDGQPWRFVVVRDREIKERIAAAKNDSCPPAKRRYPADFLVGAPLLVAVCVETKRSFDRARENGILAAATLMLAATARGLGSVYLSAYRNGDCGLQSRIGALLRLPEGFEPICLVPLGYPSEQPPPRRLRPLASMIDHA